MWATHTTEYGLALKGNSDTLYNMDEPGGHYARCNKLVTKGQVCMIPFLRGTQEHQIHRDKVQ